MKTTLPLILIILLVALNVYQYRNPHVVEVPGEQTPIDSTAWVQRSAYADRGVLLDSIEAVNENLAAEIRKRRDEIASLTNINGRLNLQVDSLETVNRLPLDISTSFAPLSALNMTNSSVRAHRMSRANDRSREPALADTSYNFVSVFGNGLFRVDSEVRFEPGYLENNLDLTQLRDIEIRVVNTMNDDRSRLLTYVTSQDFEELEYQTYTELEPRKRWPWFLIGVGVGVTGLAIID